MKTPTLAIVAALLLASAANAQVPPAPDEPILHWNGAVIRTVLNDSDTMIANMIYTFDDSPAWRTAGSFSGSIVIEVRRPVIVMGAPMYAPWEVVDSVSFGPSSPLSSFVQTVTPLSPANDPAVAHPYMLRATIYDLELWLAGDATPIWVQSVNN